MPLDAPTSRPTKPSLLPRSPRHTHQQRRAHEPHTRRSTRDPSALGKQPIADCGAHQLATEDRQHVRRIDAIAGLGGGLVDGGAVRDLCCLDADVDAEGLEDGAGEGEFGGVGADGGAEEAEEEAEEDGEVGGVRVDEVAGGEGAGGDGGEDEEGEEGDGDGGEEIRGAGEVEGEGCPEGSEDAAGEEADEAGLDKDRGSDEVLEDAEEDFGVAEAACCGGIIGHEQP